MNTGLCFCEKNLTTIFYEYMSLCLHFSVFILDKISDNDLKSNFGWVNPVLALAVIFDIQNIINLLFFVDCCRSFLGL